MSDIERGTAATLENLAFAPIETLGSLLAAQDISSVELTRYFLSRTATHNAALHAYSEVFDERALTQAELCDRQRHLGENMGPLHGIPVAVKEIFDIAGLPTRAGSRALDDRNPEDSATAIEKLERAGMVVLGRTHMVEFAFGGWGTNPVMGAPRNPWDMDVPRVAGGSSSGSAVAVAAGLAPAALGTDTGGSVRTPATWCGVTGLKTSHGLIGRGGVVPLCPTHDTVGTFTRSAKDAAMLLEALVGLDARDGATRTAPASLDFSRMERSIEGLRVGRLADGELEGVDPEICALNDAFIAELETLGAKVEFVILPIPARDYLKSGGEIMSYESYRALGHYVERENSGVDAVIADRILAGRDISEQMYQDVLSTRKAAQKAYAKSVENIDAVIIPGCHQIAPPLTEVNENEPPNFFGRMINFLDLAAISVPLGLTSAGMPAGAQIAVRKFEDMTALRIASKFERSQQGRAQNPPHF